jgi:hypothetical protein
MEVGTNHNSTLPPVAGHTFAVSTYNVCLACHPVDPQGFSELWQDFVIKARIETVVGNLNNWATNKSPAVLRTNYGALAWEYTTPGELSSGTNAPPTALQSQIPDNIKKARFNLYVVQNDGSFGVHNPLYSVTLLDSALTWVQQELNK